MAGKISEDFLDKQLKKKQMSVEKFREALEETATKVKENDRGLIVLIDELDRCRPTYAIEMLEVIKHLFSVKGVKFILAADMMALENAVEAIYGRGVDRDGYLLRLVDWNINLPKSIWDCDNFACHLYEKFKISDFCGDPETVTNHFSVCTKAWGLRLRDQIKCFKRLSLLFQLQPDLAADLASECVIFMGFKAGDPHFYKTYIEKNLSLEELLDYFGDRLGYKTQSRHEQFQASYSYAGDTSILKGVEMISILLAIQMMDDASLVAEIKSSNPINQFGVPPEAPFTEFRNFAQHLKRASLGKIEQIKIDPLITETHSARQYLDLNISLAW